MNDSKKTGVEIERGRRRTCVPRDTAPRHEVICEAVSFRSPLGHIAESNHVIVNLSELYPDLVQGMPVTPKLRALLRQISIGIDVQKIVENNPYLARLMTECRLLFPEVFNKKLNKHWDYQVAWQFKGEWLKSLLDIVAMQDRNMLIIDWSGLEVNAIATAQAYILCQQLKLPPNKISIISLLTNDLKANHRICFGRRRIFTVNFGFKASPLTEGNPLGLRRLLM
jgi:hypothetical protein